MRSGRDGTEVRGTKSPGGETVPKAGGSQPTFPPVPGVVRCLLLAFKHTCAHIHTNTHTHTHAHTYAQTSKVKTIECLLDKRALEQLRITQGCGFHISGDSEQWTIPFRPFQVTVSCFVCGYRLSRPIDPLTPSKSHPTLPKDKLTKSYHTKEKIF